MLRELIASLRDEFDYIILDSPPARQRLKYTMTHEESILDNRMRFHSRV